MDSKGSIYPLVMIPEIQRDGTNFSNRSWVEGQWCRFYQGSPKKMGGYKEIANNIPGVSRGIMIVPTYPNFRIFIGTSTDLYYIEVDSDFNVTTALTTITPVGFAADPDNTWDFDVMYSSADDTNILIATAAPNLSSIDCSIETPIYYSDLFSADPPIPAGTLTASGGILCMHPFLFFYGNDGVISWTYANDPTTVLNIVRPTSNKIVCGLATRGGNSSPAGLFWSLDCLIRVTHTGTQDTDFTFDSISCESSVLSSQGIIEYDGIYYWAAVDRFLMYNGVVQELPNDKNLLYFFNNVDMSNRQKVWATKNTKWGEIWWHFPVIGGTGECTRSVIYSVRDKKWLDTNIARSDGEFDQTLSYPIWAGNELDGLGNSSLWAHEIGVDKDPMVGGKVAIPASIKSGYISLCAFDPNMQRPEMDRFIEITRFEPDIVQSGDITMTIGGRKYARSEDEAVQYTISEGDEKIDLDEQRRQMYLKFESNVVGGDFEFGQNLMLIRVGDGR